MRSETTILKERLAESIRATKSWMLKATQLEQELNVARSQLAQLKENKSART